MRRNTDYCFIELKALLGAALVCLVDVIIVAPKSLIFGVPNSLGLYLENLQKQVQWHGFVFDHIQV